MKKTTIIQFVLGFILILSGNDFWYLFGQTLSAHHLLSSSPLEIGLSLAYPIVILSIYLSFLILLTLFIKRRLVMYFLILLSTFIYPFLIGKGLPSVIGAMIISIALFYFSINFRNIHVFDKGSTSLSDQLTLAFSGTSLIISITLTVNFYYFYVHTLTTSNTILTNQIMVRSLSPVVKIYLNNFAIHDSNESFGDYAKRRSEELKIPASDVKKAVSKNLGLTKISDTETMKNVIKDSLDNNVLKLIADYRKEIPLLVSLGFGIITQTLISASSFMSIYLTLVLFYLFRRFKLIKRVKKQVLLDFYSPY